MINPFRYFKTSPEIIRLAVMLYVRYRAWENTSLKFGWQFYGIDFSTNRSDGKFAYDGSGFATSRLFSCSMTPPML